MYKNKIWLGKSKKTITKLKLKMGELASSVRVDQYKIFGKYIQISSKLKVLDVGVSSEEDIVGTNLFDKNYPFPEKLTLATIENAEKLRRKYTNSKIVKIIPDKNLPFKDKEYDVVVSWATLEHIGGYEKQAMFINELLRVGKKVFITTPYRGCIYEPHSGIFILHWLPLLWFRKICKFLGKEFWMVEDNLNPLYVNDLLQMKLDKGINVIIYKMFGFLPSHLIIMSNK